MLGYYQHRSQANNCDMRFAVFVPPQARRGRVPVLYYLAGLTCTEENFMTKAGALEHAARLGLMLVAPDTSPRVDAAGRSRCVGLRHRRRASISTPRKEPWSKHYRMYSYVVDELPRVIAANFPRRIIARRASSATRWAATAR